MSKLFTIIFLFILITNCSLDNKSGFWTKETNLENSKDVLDKIFINEQINTNEFNKNFKIRLTDLYTSKNILRNNNNYIRYEGELKKISKYNFSKIDRFNEFEPEIIFNKNSLIFFDNKGSVLKFNNKSKLVWKKNYYSKIEKKFNPILFMNQKNNTLIVADTISKYYALKIDTGEIIWSKNNSSPFNSQVKIHGDKFYVVDSENKLNCYSMKDGSKIWELKTEKSFINSSKKLSIVISGERLFFNNSLGDITAVDINNGNFLWQISTLKSSMYQDTFNLKTSILVTNDDAVLFSNNNNQFYSINQKSGSINWIQKINSNLAPVIIGNLIFSVSLEGYLFLINNKDGNIIRITNIFNHFKKKIKDKIEPVGFIMSSTKIYLTTNNGRLLIIDVTNGKTITTLKIDKNKISRPFISNKNFYIARDNSIIKLN